MRFFAYLKDRFLMVSFVVLTGALMALGLPACSTLATTGQSQIAYSCAAATSAVQTLTLLHSKLSAVQVAEVNTALSVITPICSSPTQPTYATALQNELAAALTTLQTDATQVQK